MSEEDFPLFLAPKVCWAVVATARLRWDVRMAFTLQWIRSPHPPSLVDFTNILREAFEPADPKSAKIQSGCQFFWAFWICACKILVKSTLGDRNVFDRKNARCYSNQSYVPTHLSYNNLSTGNAFIYQIIFNNDDQVDSFRSLVNYGESY